MPLRPLPEPMDFGTPARRPAARAAIDHLVIVAGGKGKRLAELFPDLPKALVPIGGKPVLEHQLSSPPRAESRRSLCSPAT